MVSCASKLIGIDFVNLSYFGPRTIITSTHHMGHTMSIQDNQSSDMVGSLLGTTQVIPTHHAHGIGKP